MTSWSASLGWSGRDRQCLLVLVAAWAAALAVQGASRPAEVARATAGASMNAPSVRERIDPNTASEASLCRLPQVGPGRAAAIVAYRQAAPAPAFARPEDLLGVPGIGPGILEDLRADLSLPEGPAP